MNSSLLPYVQIQVEWALHHRWQAMQAMPQAPASSNKVWLVLAGQMEIATEEQSWRLTAGSMMLTTPAHRLKIVSTANGAEWLSVGLTATLFRDHGFFDSLAHPEIWRPSAAQLELTENWMRQLVTVWSPRPEFPVVSAVTWSQAWAELEAERARRSAPNSLVAEGLGRALFGLCWQMLNLGSVGEVAQKTVPSWLQQALQIMRTEPGTSVAEVTRRTGFSPAQFRRLFQEWTGNTPHDYLARLRAEEARWLLAVTDVPVNLIAQRLGFDSISYFTRFFKRETGQTPREYRKLEMQRRHEATEVAERNGSPASAKDSPL